MRQDPVRQRECTSWFHVAVTATLSTLAEARGGFREERQGGGERKTATRTQRLDASDANLQLCRWVAPRARARVLYCGVTLQPIQK